MEKASSGKIGRYEIIKVLGRGRMGEVLLAEDKNLGRRIAIRRPAAGDVVSFCFEPKAATLRHPNIPIVYEIGVDENQPFIAMEYVEGETLQQMTEAKREIDLVTRLRIIEQICSALDYAHEKGVVHLRVKPANIIVQRDGTAKLIDFGIAARRDGDPDSVPAGLTSREKLSGGRGDRREDIFCAGVTLFHLLTGEDPIAHNLTVNEMHMRLNAHLHDHPSALDQIVARSLARSPNGVFETAEYFADALHDVIKHLKRLKGTDLFKEAERLKSEGQFAPALVLLDQAIMLDPSHSPARKLRRVVRDEQKRLRRAEGLREYIEKSDNALLDNNLGAALDYLRSARTLDPSSAELKARVEAIEEKKHRGEKRALSLAMAGEAKSRGDVAGALRMVTAALEQDPGHDPLLALKASLLLQLETETQRGRLAELQENVAHALAIRDYDAAERLLNEAAAIDPSSADIRKQSHQLVRVRELERSRAELLDTEQRVRDLMLTDAYEQAMDLIIWGLEKFPGEPILHRLKAQVDASASSYDVRRIVDLTIAQANELAASSPPDALCIVRKMLDNIPGEERLVALERLLLRRIDTK